jgi:hypothetical protein
MEMIPKLVFFAVLAACGALLLQGCGDADPPTTTVAPTTTVSTTTTVTTVTGYDGCTGKSISQFNYYGKDGHHRDDGTACFCFYSGQCRELFLGPNAPTGGCAPEMGLEWCMEKRCGQAPFKETDQFVSFFNRDQPWTATDPDVLTIPKIWFLSIKHLAEQCTDDQGEAELVALLNESRQAYAHSVYKNASITHGTPGYQCLHDSKDVSVDWMHLHAFKTYVKKERLPDGEGAICVPGNMELQAAAKAIIAKVAPPSPPANEQTHTDVFSV